MKQGSEEWFIQRIGKVTASRISDVMSKGKNGKESVTRENYKTELVLERLTFIPTETVTNSFMQWGIDCEPSARLAYEFETNQLVQEVGMISHPTIPMSGASPDGMVGTDGLLEIKCLCTKKHIDTILNDGGKALKEYSPQMQWQMACSGRSWVDFVSFDPRMPFGMQFFCKRIYRNDNVIKEYEEQVLVFLDEVDETILKLNEFFKI